MYSCASIYIVALQRNGYVTHSKVDLRQKAKIISNFVILMIHFTIPSIKVTTTFSSPSSFNNSEWTDLQGRFDLTHQITMCQSWCSVLPARSPGWLSCDSVQMHLTLLDRCPSSTGSGCHGVAAPCGCGAKTILFLWLLFCFTGFELSIIWTSLPSCFPLSFPPCFQHPIEYQQPTVKEFPHRKVWVSPPAALFPGL